MLDAVLFDLDSTIANTTHRQWMVPLIKAGGEGAPTWDDYSMACANDAPIEGTIALMNALAQRYVLFIVTGRSEAAYILTEKWLVENDVPFSDIFMRPAGDRTPNGKFKVGVINQLRETVWNPILFVDDYPEAAEYIRKHAGIPVLLVNPGKFADGQNENLGAV